MTREQIAIIGKAYAEGVEEGYGTSIDAETPEGDLWQMARDGWTDNCDDATWAILHPDRHALKAAQDAFADGYIAGQRLQSA